MLQFSAGAFAIGFGGELVHPAALRDGRKHELAAARALIVNAARHA